MSETYREACAALGVDACRAARDLVEAAPEPTPAQLADLAVLMRRHIPGAAQLPRDTDAA